MYKNTLFNLIFYNTIYDCSVITQDFINDSSSRKHLFLGSIYFVMSLIYIIIYIPFLIAMFVPQNFKHPAYKIMSCLGLIDIIGLACAGPIAGIFSIRGDVYCSFPVYGYWAGSFAYGAWVGNNCSVLLLVVNRCLDLAYPTLSDILFSGIKTFVWLLFPLLMMLYCIFFAPNPMYTSIADTYIFDPYYGTAYQNSGDFTTVFMFINNYIICLAQVIIYVIFIIIFCIKYLFNSSYSTLETKTIGVQLFMQAFLICMLTLSTSLIYVLMERVSVPNYFSIIAHFDYLTSSGISGIIYLIMNKSLKDTIKKWYRSSFNKQSITTKQIQPSRNAKIV
uniref:G_PROTEIN_RECEP_F1_2 domain-containing protein n=1 Tax=Rhabditophanes sp. KR3021 TaxID=114890 RepID=A0AC35U3C1_9BILA